MNKELILLITILINFGILKGEAFVQIGYLSKYHTRIEQKESSLFTSTQLFGKRKRFFNLFKGRRHRKESRKLLSEEDIHNLFFQWNNALVSGDSTAVASLYAKDAVLIATSSNERKMDFASIKGYFDPVVRRDPSTVILNRTVKIGQDFAMDVGIYEWTFGDDGSKKKARFTFVYVPNESGTWEIAHHHSSALPQQYF
jgi:uncharacterized protein (TIGR02246 family)